MDSSAASPSSSLSSSVSPNWEYRVFPSFFREDGFFSHFQKEFERKGITLFMDRRESFGPVLVEAIRRSRIAIILISEHYASSALLLDELVEIMKCRKELGQTVIPIFYEVEPSNVRRQRGEFGHVFKKVCVGRSVEDVEKWKQALYKVTKISGYDLRHWQNEEEMVEYVANNVSNMLNKAAPSRDFDGLVGMENHITQITSLLSLESDDVRMVGIWGPAGIGKTTIARALYKKLSNNFTYTAFMESTRGRGRNIYRDDHAFMLHLQERLVSNPFNHMDLKIRYLGMANVRLEHEKVLVVVDGVDGLWKLKSMAGKTKLFGCGSRIIITANDKKLLKAHGINHIYHVEFPCSSEALEIFCLSAFDQKFPYVGFEELAMEITGLAGNLPLGLNVYGSYLRGMCKGEWMHALPRLRTSLDSNIEKVIRWDYETLCNKDRDLFLHIACFFKGERTSNLVECFSNLDVMRGLHVLAEKSLITIDNGARLVMIHNLLEQLGTEISRKNKYIDENGRRRIVVDDREICDVLTDDTGYGSVLGTNLVITDERASEGMFDPLTALSPLPSSCTHQIFTSFWGVGVRRSFINHMLMVFRNKGIISFTDNQINRGMSIDLDLNEAIKGSKILIVLISNKYASSRWCLDELVVIMKCSKELSKRVIPIFFEVKPSAVKRQRGHFGSIFREFCWGISVKKVKKWKQALYEVASIAGYDSRDWENEAEMIERIANDVSNMLTHDMPSRDFDGLVGMENHIMQLSSLLSLDSNEVRMVGLWGPAGIGKTTIARAVYRKLSSNFTHTAFMERIKASHEKTHIDDHAYMLYLQEQLLCQTFNHKDLKIYHLGVAEERLKDKKILVVLNDVDDIKQLKAMASKTHWFGSGSRIIITTTDKKLLKAHGISHIYHMELPCSSDAIEILCQNAFGQKSPYVGFEELTMEVAGLAGDLPLGLSVYGSYLRGMSKEEWISALPRLRKSLVPEIKEILRYDYEALWDKDKYLFLHIACFFNGKKTTNLVKHLSNLDVTHGLQVLTEKSLISIDKDARLVMHSLLEQLGKEIAYNEYGDEYGRCNFVVDARGIDDVHATGTTSFESIEGRTYKGIVDPFKRLSLSPSSCSHQVFPSFCGVDVRKAFLPHMLKEFRSKGITPFIDNDIARSMPIGPELKEAIRGCRVSIVIISKNYASSTWCLDELVLIMKCREELGQIVMTIFYEVEPTDVKKQVGYFGSTFEKTCVGKSVEDVEKWKQALEEVATIAGFDSTTWKDEAEMIESVANDILNKLNMGATSRDFDGLVGMENHIMQISSLLSLDSNDVRMVGIWGPAGIGKTTIARTLYNKLSNSFTHTCFMESIRGSGEKIRSDDYAFMLHLQEQLLSKIFNYKDLKIHHLGVVEERLKDKKVLLVIDDVDDLKQLKAMAGKTHWFGCGSRIIVTTKDARLLKAHEIDHIYHVEFPLLYQAYEIFCRYAFGQKSSYDGFEELAMEVTGLAGVLPLGLSVFGSYLRGRSKEDWISALPRLKTSLDGDIEKVLRFSYEALCDKDKALFLHIACLFEGESISYLEKCLAGSGLEAKHGLKVLAEKSLISITEEERLVIMHNLVEQLGKEIVRQEHKDEPERRRFLVDAGEICDVLTDNTGSKSVLGIDLDITAIKDELCIDKRAFEGMTRLQFLRLKSPYSSGKNNKLILPLGLNNLPRKLRVLRWDEFPLRCLPPEFAAEFLVILEMRNSCIEKLWEGAPPLRHLKLMDMSYSSNLKDVPNVSNATNLETLVLNACESLVEIPTWFQNLSSLTHLKMVGCKKLMVLPTNINMESLYHLDLSHCTQLKTFPEISTRIGYLDLENTGIEEVPSSIRSWPHLAKLSMRGCKSLRMFPDVLDSMEELN